MSSIKKCDKCKTEFVAYNTEAKLCKECKEEALAELDRNSDDVYRVNNLTRRKYVWIQRR
jgi:uncharacterized Zn ribbon protein